MIKALAEKWNQQDWEHALEMYPKWARLQHTRMMQKHRNRFPTQTRIFDQIDLEILGEARD